MRQPFFPGKPQRCTVVSRDGNRRNSEKKVSLRAAATPEQEARICKRAERACRSSPAGPVSYDSNTRAVSIAQRYVVSGNATEGLDEKRMFALQYPGCQSLGRIAPLNGHFGLSHNLATVIIFIDTVYGNARHGIAGRNDRFVYANTIHSFPTMTGQESRVYVENPVMVSSQHLDREHAHITEQQNEVGLFLGKNIKEFLRHGLLVALGLQADVIGRYSLPTGAFQSKCTRIVTDDSLDTGLYPSLFHRIDDSL